MQTIIFVFLVFALLSDAISIEAAAIKNSHFFQSIDTSNEHARQARIYFDQLAGFMPPMLPMLPIEINVPDSIMGMMNGMMAMWSAMQEYFSSENSVVPRIAALLELIV